MLDEIMQNGIIIRGVGGLFGVRPLPLTENDKVILCRARGIFRHEKITPLPGDLVRYTRDSDAPAVQDEKSAAFVIEEILPRKSALIRPPLANLTHLFVAIPAARPAPDLKTADKLIAIAEDAGIETVILVTKEDLAEEKAQEIAALYKRAGFTTFTLSADHEEKIEQLRHFIGSLSANGTTVTAAFAGASGAGKSTLMTKLFPDLTFKTGEISKRAERGRQTTRHVELYPFEKDGHVCLIADTPGFSILDFTRFNFFDPSALPEAFREFRPHLGACRYTKCTHTKEEECAVLAAVQRGDIPKERHESYVEIFTEMKKKPDWKRRREETIR